MGPHLPVVSSTVTIGYLSNDKIVSCHWQDCTGSDACHPLDVRTTTDTSDLRCWLRQSKRSKRRAPQG